MEEIKKIVCCLLAAAMLIDSGILCIAEAEDIQIEKETELILQMEPVQQIIPAQETQKEEQAAEYSGETPAAYAPPVIDLTTATVSERTIYERKSVNVSVFVSNQALVQDLCVIYCPKGTRQGTIWKLAYNADTDFFEGSFWPIDGYGEYEVLCVELTDQNGKVRRIYNSGNACILDGTISTADDSETYDLSVLDITYVGTQISTMAELKGAVENATAGETIEILLTEEFVVDESITIPYGVKLQINFGGGSFKVAEGVTFTTESEFSCNVPMTIAGTWKCNGNPSYCNEGLRITSTGSVENKGHLLISGEYDNQGTLTTSGSADASLEVYVRGLTELKAAIARENPGPVSVYLYSDDVSNEVVLTEDVVIPKSVFLIINSGSPLTVNEGVTFTTMGGFYCRGTVTVAGVWKCNGSSQCDGGLNITSTGNVENTGYLWIIGEHDNQGILSTSASATTFLSLRVHNFAELEAALRRENPGQMSISLDTSGEAVFAEDLTIPEGVSLTITENTLLTISEGVTFTTEGSFTCNAPMTVAGTWINSAASTCCDGLTITTTGIVDSKDGSLCLEGAFVNNGILEEGSRIQRTLQVSSITEVRAAIEDAIDGDHINVIGYNEDLIVDQDLTIPKGVYLNIRSGNGGFKVAEGVTFTTESRFSCDAPVTIAGTWKCVGANCGKGLSITSTGCVENDDYLSIGGEYINRGTMTTPCLEIGIYSFAELKTALTQKLPKQTRIQLYAWNFSGGVVFTEDLTLPEGVFLCVYEGMPLTISEGVTFTTEGRFTCDTPMTVAGTWINKCYGSTCYGDLTITTTGVVDSRDGSFHLEGNFVNNGTLVNGSNMNQTIEVHSVDELQSALATVVPGGEVKLKSEKEAVLSGDMVIPKGIAVEVYESVQSLRIAADSKLVIDAEATLRSYAPLIVEGAVDNYGAIGARKGLSVTGKIENYNYIRIEGNLVGAENIRAHEAGNQSVCQRYAVDSEETLRNTLNTIPVSSRDWIRLMAAEGFALTKDITIPAGVYLEIQTGEFKVNSGATLTTYDNLIVNGDMRVDGCWENLWNRTGHSEVGGALTVNGMVENSGRIELCRYSEVLKSEQKKIQNSGSGQLNISATVTSMEELQKISEIESCSNKSATWQGISELKLDKDLTIPDGMGFYASSAKIIIPTGVTLTVGNNAYVLADSIDAQGTLLNNGSIFGSTITECGKIVNHSFLQSDSITVSGELINTSRLMCHNDITVSGRLTNSNSVSFSMLRIEDSGYVGNAGVLMGKIENRGRLEQMERTGENGVFYVSLRTCDWKDVFANIRSGDTINGNSWSAAYIEITEDTTLPENVSINGLNFRVKEGVAFTTRGSGFKPYTLQVDGTWVNNGSVELDRLVVNGNVQNNGSVTAREAVTGTGVVMGNSVASANVSQSVYGLILQETLRNAKPGDVVSCCNNYYNGSSQIFGGDITVPAGVILDFSGISKVYLTAGHTFTIDGTLILQQPLYAAGDLVINGEVVIPSADEVDLEHMRYLELVSGSIGVVEGGSCTLNGGIRAGKTDYTGQAIEDPRALITGVAMEGWSLRDVDGYWYLTRKPAADKTEVFCSLPVMGCKLQLVDGDGNVRELMTTGGYALINDIAAGKYTLEVSKPGYVTHAYKVDTKTLPDVLDVELVRKGDVNGAATAGGAVDVTDMACLYALLSTGRYSGQIADAEYQNAVADVNGDGRINILDYQRLYRAVQGTAPLT